MFQPVAHAAPRSFSIRLLSKRAVLFAGVSAVALFTGSQDALARPLGGGSSSAPTAAPAAAMATAQAASQAAVQASAALKRATLSIQAMQAAQQAARGLAQAVPSGVTNGLQAGGLVVMPGATPGATNGGAGLWQGASLPTETTSGGRTQVTIQQNDPKAILNWKEFNVGRETDLYFDQRAGGADARNWIALNRVDGGTAPSQVLGTIKAEGQVYVINRNGIVFGGASQVNVQTLVAASLSLSNAQFMAGINKELYVFDDPSANSISRPQFGYLDQQRPLSGVSINNPQQVQGALIGAAPGDVRVDAGAQISIANGGKAMLFAPRVFNSGLISAPDGQVIMAAGEQIYLRSSLSGAGSESGKIAVRGLDVAASAPMRWMFSYTQAALETDAFSNDIRNIILPEMEQRAASVGYRVVNSGVIQADHGNITLTGRDVMQSGALLASTALNNRDGSIRLQGASQGMGCYSSSYCEPSAGILWTWKTGTVTLAQGSVTAAMPDLSDTSEMEISSLSTRYSPGRVEVSGNFINIEREASVIVPAGTITVVASTDGWATNEPATGEKKRDGSRIYVGENAYLSVAGLQDILVAMDRNVVDAELRINELRDSPLFRDSWLRGKTIYIDRRVSGTFADGPMSGVRWLMDKDGNFIPGAWRGTPLADVSGRLGVGKTDIAELSTQGGSILFKSSGSLITRAGSLLDVSGGSVRYSDGWIKTTKLVGADGRIYDIGQATPDRAYVGIAGGFTRHHERAGITETWMSLFDRGGPRFERGYTEGRNAGAIQFYAAEGIVLEGGYWAGAIAGERQAASGKLAESGSLTFGGTSDDDRQWLLGNLVISHSPTLLPADFSATTPLSSFWYSGTSGSNPPADDSYLRRTTHLDSGTLASAGFGSIELYVSKSFTLQKGTTLDLMPGASLTVQANTADSVTQDFRVDGVIRASGGTVKLNQAENVYFGTDAVVDVSGRWVADRTDATTVSAPVIDGGNIEVANARFSPGAVLDVSGGGWYRTQKGKREWKTGDAGSITFADIDAAELAKVDLRGYAAGSGGSLSLTTNASLQIGGAETVPAGTVRLAETLYSDRGFRSVQLTSRADITVADGATIRQLPLSVRLTDVSRLDTATSIADVGQLAVLPLLERMELAPTSLSLSGRNATIGVGASVATDVGGSITIASSNSVAGGVVRIDGRLEALAGKINVSATSGTLAIGSGAALVASGIPLIEADQRGMRGGDVLGGGTVVLEAGSATLAAHSSIDVSGVSGVIDVSMEGIFGARKTAPMMIASDGGSISFKGQGVIDGTWRGQAGGTGARNGAISLNAPNTLTLSEGSTAQIGLVFRPSVLSQSSFADLTLNALSIRLEGIDLALGNSIAITGALVNGNGADARLSAPYISLNGTSVAAPGASGTLTLAADVIDIKRGFIRGFATAVLEAADIQLSAFSLGQAASLDMTGALILRAAQIYPASQASATISASEKIVVQQNGAAGVALSAGGALTLQAPVIEQGGTLRAPFGQLTLKASDRLVLGAGSVTSVSGDGLVLPYGNLSNNENWTLPVPSGLPTPITAPPEKRITLEAPSVNLAAGSVVDIRGGGDLHAVEHVPGPGGSHDILTRPGMYAIMPSMGAVSAIGERVWLDGGSGIAPGWYTLLPARYALLPGAYAIQMISGSRSASVRRSFNQPDGSEIVSGYRGNAFDGSQDQLRSSWRVMSGHVVRQYSEYNEAFANTFFASDAFKLTQYRLTGKDIVTPRLPMDGGAVVFKATQDLILNGQLRSQAADGGRGGLVDIAAAKIAVVGADQDAASLRGNGYLVLDATSLSNFGAGSLLLGGIRSGDSRGLRVNVTAGSIVVRNSASSAFSGSEIILAASDAIDIEAGSVIVASGDAPRGAGDLVIAPQIAGDSVTPSRDWGALIRLSNGEAVRVLRENVDLSAGGVVTIGAGATLAGGKALLIDATRNTYMRPGAQLSGKTLSVSSGRIGFGGGSGLVLDAVALAMLRSTENLILRSYTSIDFYDGLDLSGLRSVNLDAALLAGYGSGTIEIVANRLVLENTTSTFSAPAGTGHGQLNLRAEELVFGQGAKALRGFDAAVLTGTARIVGESKGSLDAGDTAVTMLAPILTGRGGAAQSLTTTAGVTVATHGNTVAERDQGSLGSRWSLTGGSVFFGGRANALGGTIELAATHGDVTLAAGALIDVGGFGKQFFDVAEYTDAGRIVLTAAGGSVRMDAGAMLDLAAQPGGGGAGSLVITSDGSQLVLDGTIKAQAAAGQRGGAFSIDVAQLPNFGALNQRLNEAGFSRSRSFRIRGAGDVTVDGTTVTEAFSLSADQGRVTIAGIIDARARYGGSIAIYGGTGLTMTGSGVLRAGATDTVDYLGSGRVTLGISGGLMAVQGGLIDVAGGEGGKVTLRAPVITQPGADTVNVTFAGNIAGAREIVLEGFRQFDLASLANNAGFVGVKINGAGQAELDLAATAAGKLNVLADYGAGTLVEFVRDFDISAAYGGLGGLAGQSNFHARPGMELNYAGDIVLKSNWNLGAGSVDQAAAMAAGVMAMDTVLGKTYVVPGQEGRLLRDYTTMVYRTRGSILGESGVLTLRAEGNVDLKGSISDGFFQFGNPLDTRYVEINKMAGSTLSLILNGGRNNTTSNLTPYSNSLTALPSAYAGISFSTQAILKTQTAVAPQTTFVPFNADANTPHAATPNEIGNAALLPSITRIDGTTVAASSWSQTLVAGAAPVGQSADPTRRLAGAAGHIVLSAQPQVSYVSGGTAVFDTTMVDADPAYNPISKPSAAAQKVDPASWLTTLETAAGARLNADSTAALNIGTTSEAGYAYLLNLWNTYATARGVTDYKLITATSRVNVVTKYSIFADFYRTQILPNLRTIALLYSSVQPTTITTAITPTMMRTGTGDITVSANGDIKLDGGASIYTAGRRDLARLDDFTTASDGASFGVAGGHLRIDVGGSIDAALPADRSQMQHYVEWLKKQGGVDGDYVFNANYWHSSLGIQPVRQSAWWIDYGNFQRGVGALGGGNITVSAGGDLNNLTVALPTNGRVRGGRSIDERKLLELRNGGSMAVDAGGAIRAGYYYVGRGAGRIDAGELDFGRTVAVRAQQNLLTTYSVAPILSLGDATLDVHAAGSLTVQTLLDPLMVGRGDSHELTYMSGQTDQAALNLTSAGGDVRIVGQVEYLSKDLDFTVPGNTFRYYAKVNSVAGNLYPSRVHITALNGSVVNAGLINMLPGSRPELQILAGKDIYAGNILMSRATWEMIPSPLEPVGGDAATVQFTSSYDFPTILYNRMVAPPSNLNGHQLHLYGMRNPEHLPNENDHDPSRIYALSGSIIGSQRNPQAGGTPAAFVTNEAAWFRAGKDIRNIDYGLRNVRTTDVTLFEAGNDIIGGDLSVGSSVIDRPGFARLGGQIEIQGPGALVVSAGRDVYGTNLALLSTGNEGYDYSNRIIPGTRVAGLPEHGASISVLAGLRGKQPSYDAFAAAYLDPANVASMPDYLKTTLADGTVIPIYLTDAVQTRKSGIVKTVRDGLVSFVEEMTGEKLTPSDAWARFRALPQLTKERFLRKVYIQELREAGDDQTTLDANGKPRNQGYNRGYAAIEKLFPGQDWKGDVTMGNGLFRTMAGGDIEVLTPGGGLQIAGLGAEVPAGYGLVTLGYGDINVFARNDVIVNRSRMLTFAGGDETIWSTLGDIDAGRGAKTTRVPSAPEIKTDANGVTQVLETPDISGSGIGTIIGFTGVEEGDVYPVAPQGTFNAGDAGVRVSGNIVVAALHVMNAENIQAAGEKRGVPSKPITIPALTPPGSDSNQRAATDAAKDATQSGRGQQPSVIIVEVLGYGGGDDSSTEQDEDNARKRRDRRSYNPNSAVQYVGAGQLTGEQRRQLIGE